MRTIPRSSPSSTHRHPYPPTPRPSRLGGDPPKIIITFERSHAWLISAVLSWNANDLPLSQEEVVQIFLEELLLKGVILQRKDLTEEQKLLEEEDEREDAMRRKSVAVELTSDKMKEKAKKERRASRIVELDLDQLYNKDMVRKKTFKPVGEEEGVAGLPGCGIFVRTLSVSSPPPPYTHTHTRTPLSLYPTRDRHGRGSRCLQVAARQAREEAP